VDALQDFYTSTNGDEWHWFLDTSRFGVPWNFSTAIPDPCTDNWQGINCIFNSTISEYHHVNNISLTARGLSGSLPNTLDQLTALESFSADFNNIGGTIPATLGNLTHLRIIDLYSNVLTGGIPFNLTQLTTLTFIDLGDNLLEGTIPQAFGDLHNLDWLSLHINQLSGTIPSSLGQCTHIHYLNIGSNLLSGAIPESLGLLVNATQVLLYVNALSGTIPAGLSGLSSVQDLDLGANMLHGTIPANLSALLTLRQLFMDSNQLTGTVPDELHVLTDLHYLYFRANYLHGSLPDSFGSFHKMIEFIAYQNHLTGTIPDSFSNWQRSQYLDYGDNLLHGTIGSYYGRMGYLQYLHLDANHLSGTIPPELGNCSDLIELLVYTNNLHGTLPTALSGLSRLTTLLVQYNKLTGPITGVFNATTQHLMTTVKINNNRLSGTLDDELLKLPSLNVLVAASNCFRGSLPTLLCNASRLGTLSLDGLSSASSCRDTLLPGLSSSYAISDSFTGTAYPCLFTMPRLNTLHLSGVGLTGTLPQRAAINPVLIDLALSHNTLTGTIPVEFQEKLWYSLDLSYNRLTGTLKSSFASEQFQITDDEVNNFKINATADVQDISVTLENNRLSGIIPGSVQTLRNVSVLGSNLFQCDLAGDDLPLHDEGRGKYECGSTSFDVPFYTWLALVAVAAGLCGVVWFWQDPLGRYFNATHVFSDLVMWGTSLERCFRSEELNLKGRMPSVESFTGICDMLCGASLWSTAYIMFVLLPILAAASMLYGTLTYQYTYTVSAAFLTGKAAAGLQFAAFFVLLISTAVFCWVRVRKFETSGARDKPISVMKTYSVDAATSTCGVWAKYGALYAVFALINLTVVVGVNVAYVYAVIYKSNDYLLAAQILVAFFKFLWNGIGTTYLVRWTTKRFMLGSDQVWQSRASQTRFILIQVFIALLNNIAIPCIVVAVVSPSCFSDVFSPAPAVSAPYNYEICLNLIHGECIKYTVVESRTTYKPSFNYSYQCSSSIVTYYAPAFVTLCIITTLATPVAQLTIKLLNKRATPGSFLYHVTDRLLPRILKPLATDPASILQRARHGVHRPFFHANRLLILLLSYLGMLLTFGAVFPLLGLCFTLSLLSVTYFAKLKVGRFLCAVLAENKLEYLDLIEAECRRAGASVVVRRSLWLLLAFSSCFYALFIFDALGDQVGFKRAYWVLIVVPLFPVGIFAASMLHRYLGFSLLSAEWNAKSAKTAGDIEMDAFTQGSNEDVSKEVSSALHTPQ
jgi:Leucine-rich repeat (LRR) protein